MGRLPLVFALPLSIACLLPVPATRAQQRVPVPNALSPEEPESRPGQAVVVPDLQGLPLPLAVLRLGTVRLGLSSVRPLDTAAGTEGTVVRQSPPPGTRVPPGSAVQLWIARPRPVQNVVVPDLAGLPEAEARARLGRVNLRIGALEPQDTAAGTEGTVVRQSPPPGTRVPPGSAVQPLDRQAEAGAERGGARSGRAAGGRGQSTPGQGESPDRGTGAPGHRGRDGGHRRSPGAAAGTRVPPGSAVQLWIARPRPVQPNPPISGVTVPDLRGLTMEAARDLIDGTQLQLGEAGSQGSDPSTGKRVVAQQPAPGTRAPLGATVQVWLNEERRAPAIPWPWLAIGAGLIGAGLAWRSRMAAKSSAPLRMMGLRDPGEQRIETRKVIQADWQIRICPQVDQGYQSLLPLDDSVDGGK